MSEASVNVLSLGKTPTRTVLKLAWPTILEQVAFTVLQFSDTAMVGALGAAYTAAVGISSPFMWLVGGLISAVGMGFSVQVAQSIGAGDLQKARRVIGQAFAAALVVACFMLALCFTASFFLPGLMGGESEVILYAKTYMGILSLSTFLNSFVLIFSAILRCMGNTRTPMAASLASILLNIVANFFLIFPARTVVLWGREFFIWGAGLGIAGAAWGTLVALTVSTLLVFLAIVSPDNHLRLELNREALAEMFTPEKDILSAAARLGAPVALERAVASFGQVLFMRVVSTLGTVSVAAHHLAISAESLSYLPAFGFAMSATTLVGQAVGAGRPEEARRFGHVSAGLGGICMTLSGVFLFLFADPLIALFSREAAVIALGGAVLRIVAFAQPPQALSIIYSGALRGAGDSRWPFYISLAGVWGIRLVLGCLFTFAFRWGLEGIWLAMLIDLVFRGAVTWWRFAKGGWLSAEGVTQNQGVA